MTIELKSAVGGGAFVTKTHSTVQSISSGVTGVLATITPPADQRVRLEFLATAATTAQPGISVDVGGVNVVPTSNLIQPNATSVLAGDFVIGGNIALAEPILGDVDESVEIIKDAGNTTQAIEYTYSYGE